MRVPKAWGSARDRGNQHVGDYPQVASRGLVIVSLHGAQVPRSGQELMPIIAREHLGRSSGAPLSQGLGLKDPEDTHQRAPVLDVRGKQELPAWTGSVLCRTAEGYGKRLRHDGFVNACRRFRLSRGAI